MWEKVSIYAKKHIFALDFEKIVRFIAKKC